MRRQLHDQKSLETKLSKYNFSRSYVFLLSTGRRTPSMKLAKRIMQEHGIKPEFWIDLNKKYEATK